jgi:hypothetical protein
MTTFTCDLDQPGQPFPHFWEHTVGSGHAAKVDLFPVMNPAHTPEHNGKTEPNQQGREKTQYRVPRREELPEGNSEAGKPNGTQIRSARVKRCGFSAPGIIGNSRAPFLFGFVFFNQGGAGGKDGRKSEKEATQNRPVMLRDEAGCNRYHASKKEAQSIFKPLRPLQCRKIETCCHTSLFQENNPSAERTAQPDDQTGDCCQLCVPLLFRHQVHADPGIDEKGAGADDHGTRFECRVGLALIHNRKAESGQRHRGRRAEKPGKAFRLEHITNHSEQRNYQPTDDKPEYQFHSFSVQSLNAISPNAENDEDGHRRLTDFRETTIAWRPLP